MKKIIFDNGENRTTILIDDARAQRQFEAWAGDLIDMMGSVVSTSVNCVKAEDWIGEATLKLASAGTRSRGRWLNAEPGVVPLWEIESI